MKYLSVCSGIEAATVAWHGLDWTPVGFSEIEPFPSAVLQYRYPSVPNLGDMTNYKEWQIERPDLLVGGTPCQSFSVAGLRKGLDDPRGNLALIYCGILDYFRPQWFVWENVPGVLSSGGGRDFGSFLGAVAQLGYGFAYRVLDAQWFGVAQRRRRVFVVGYFGDWRPAAAVLFEHQSLRRNTAPSREKREGATPSTSGSVENSSTGFTTSSLAAYREGVGTLRASGGDLGGGSETLIAFHHNVQASQLPTDARDTSISDALTVLQQAAVAQPIAVDVYNQSIDGQTAATLKEACGGTNTSGPKVMQAVAQPITAAFKGGQGSGAGGIGYSEHVAPTLPASDGGDRTPTLLNGMAVRRLTPVECERLQGFPDNYTEIPWRGKTETPDGPRYKALGNSMAVPVMKWIGEGIDDVNSLV